MSSITCNTLMKMSTSLNNRSWAPWVATVGLIAILVATALPLLRFEGSWVKYLYAAGALSAFAGRLFTPVPDGISFRLRRMLRLETWSALIFIAGAVFLFLSSDGTRDWIAFTLAGGLIQAYTSIMIPRLK